MNRLQIWAILWALILVGGIHAAGNNKPKKGEKKKSAPNIAPSIEGENGLDTDDLSSVNSMVVADSKTFRQAIEDPKVEVIYLASDVFLRRDLWPDVPRRLPELSIIVNRNLTITTHPVLPFAALLDLDYMENRVTAASEIMIKISGIVMAGVTRDPLSYLTVPFFQFRPKGVVLLENCQYQIAIEPSRLGPLGIYPSKIASTARPAGFEDWPVEMQLVSPTECPKNIVREAPCSEGALWVGSLSARATVFDGQYRPLGKAAFLLKNVFMLAINLDKGRPSISDESKPFAKTVTVTDSFELMDGLSNANVTLIYVAENITIDRKVFRKDEDPLKVERNLTITTHLSLRKPAVIDLQHAKGGVVATLGISISLQNLKFRNVSTNPETFELIPFFRFDPGSVYSFQDVVSEIAISPKFNKLTQLPFILYGGQPPPGFENSKNFVNAVDAKWCKKDGRVACPKGALWIQEGIRRVQVFDKEGVTFLGNGFMVAMDMLAVVRDVSEDAKLQNEKQGKPALRPRGSSRKEAPLAQLENVAASSEAVQRSPKKEDSSFVLIMVYVLAGIVAIIVFLLLGVLWLWRGNRKKAAKYVDSKESTHSVGEEMLQEHQTVAEQLLGDMKLGALLGWGSFGRVYKGLWGGAQVAVKVILHQAGGPDVEDVEQEANFSLKLRHPNVVQTYQYATRSIRVDPDTIGSGSGQEPPGVTPVNSHRDTRSPSPSCAASQSGYTTQLVRNSRTSTSEATGMNLPTNWLASQVKSKISDSGGTMHSAIRSWYSNPNHAKGSEICGSEKIALPRSETAYESWKETWLVQEYCELGSLGKQNILRANKLPSAWGLGEPDMAAIVETCQDIARGMKYLHDNNVVHGDLKCDNVLLQRNHGNMRGFIAKVADFGLSRQLHNATHMSTKSYGTITHMPPELLLNGHLSTKVDVYSFAIIMWELVAGEPPFRTLRHAEVMRTVVVDNARPKFAFGTPVNYVRLVELCWDRDPNIRPSFGDVLVELDKLSRVTPIEGEPDIVPCSCNSPASTNHDFNPSSNDMETLSSPSDAGASSAYETSDYSYRRRTMSSSLTEFGPVTASAPTPTLYANPSFDRSTTNSNRFKRVGRRSHSFHED
ncbi:hypothetical protein BSKO_00478 [Bryopsis sp. KO-2023]|nr:hypothetical protein BSKO_00478 [Bryopsis sp. KO-2023]